MMADAAAKLTAPKLFWSAIHKPDNLLDVEALALFDLRNNRANFQICLLSRRNAFYILMKPDPERVANLPGKHRHTSR